MIKMTRVAEQNEHMSAKPADRMARALIFFPKRETIHSQSKGEGQIFFPIWLIMPCFCNPEKSQVQRQQRQQRHPAEGYLLRHCYVPNHDYFGLAQFQDAVRRAASDDRSTPKHATDHGTPWWLSILIAATK